MGQFYPALPMHHRPPTRRIPHACTLVWLCCFGAHAAESTTVPASQPASTGQASSAPETPPDWEGALGLIVHSHADFQGSDSRGLGLTPAFYLRYKRLTLSNSGGFVTRRRDDVVRGLGLDLVRRERLHVSLALRLDRGRQESSSEELRGMGDVRSTLRLRAGATWQWTDAMRLGASWSVDALARGGGNVGDVSLTREHSLGNGDVLSWGGSLSLAGDRYMQSYYGVSAEQSQRSGRPVYTPGAGLRDAAVFVGVRGPLGPRWSYLAGLSASRLLGPAADSPLVSRPFGWGANAGLAWRF